MRKKIKDRDKEKMLKEEKNDLIPTRITAEFSSEVMENRRQ
jgi:hypothetical protein